MSQNRHKDNSALIAIAVFVVVLIAVIILFRLAETDSRGYPSDVPTSRWE